MPIVPHLWAASPKANFPRVDWRRKLAGARRVLVATDFDGTLAEIVPEPDAATPVPGAQAALTALAAAASFEVAIVSGRSLADLVARCPVPGAWYLGGHGNEILPPARPPSAQEADLTAARNREAAERRGDGPQRVARLAEELRPMLARWPGTWLEVKPWSVGVHYRRAPQWESAVLAYAADLAGQRGFRLVPGNCIAELLPSTADNKGQALLGLRARLRCDLAVYFGDEATDEDVFALADDRLVGVHVGPPSPAQRDGWDDRPTAAAFWLASPQEVVACLQCLPACAGQPAAPQP